MPQWLCWLGALGISLCVCATELTAESFCAFEVRVKKPSGAPFPNTDVGLIDAGVQIASSRTDANGVARLCDAPLHKTDIAVGAIGQGLTMVKLVKPTWPATRRIMVVRDDRHWDELTYSDTCQILLRIQDQHGRPLQNARFDGDSLRVVGTVEASDRIGRLFRKLQPGGSLNGSIRKQGYAAARVKAECISDDVQDFELKITLSAGSQ